MPDLEMETRSRSFGVEVEFVGDRNAAVDSLRAHGLLVADNSNYSFQPPPGHFAVVSDASVGWEMKTPILQWYKKDENNRWVDREQLRTAVMALGRGGARVSERAGIHVHIGCRELEAKQMARVVCFFAKFEDAFYRIASSGWNEIRPAARTYCPPLTRMQITKINKAQTAQQLERAWNYGSISSGGRRKGINLTKWWSNGTVEFRVFNSSLNPDRVLAYVTLCVGTVQDGIHCKRRISKPFMLGDMVEGRADPSYVRHAFLGTLQHTTKTIKNLTKEDAKLIDRFWKDSKPQRRELAADAYEDRYSERRY